MSKSFKLFLKIVTILYMTVMRSIYKAYFSELLICVLDFTLNGFLNIFGSKLNDNGDLCTYNFVVMLGETY